MRRIEVWHSACSKAGVLELQSTLLKRAAQITGGDPELCEYLGVSEARLRLWLAGSVRLPDPIFLKAVDLVLQDDIARAAHDRRQRPREAPVRRARANSLAVG